jgi:hypothetical protein
LKLKALSRTINTTSIIDVIPGLLLIGIAFSYLFSIPVKGKGIIILANNVKDAKAIGLPGVSKSAIVSHLKNDCLKPLGVTVRKISLSLSLSLSLLFSFLSFCIVLRVI